MKRLMTTSVLAAVAALIGACGHMDRYEAGVSDYDPTYCYKSLGGVQCYKTPQSYDERRLVNYYGPHPSRYDEDQEEAELKPERGIAPPPPIDYFVRDPEPIPTAAPAKAGTEALPWRNKGAPGTETAETGDIETLSPEDAEAYAAEEAERAREEKLLKAVREAVGGL